MKSAYPISIPEWENDIAEKQFEFVRNIIHSSRSLLGDYNIKKDATRNHFIFNFNLFY